MRRQLNYELLRVIAMFLIVIWHFVIHGSIKFGSGHELQNLSNAPLYNIIIYSIVGVISSCGVNLFVLISSHFMSQSF